MGDLEAEIQDWYERNRRPGGLPPDRYVVCAALAVLEQARSIYPLTRDAFETQKGQVKTSRATIQRILGRYGENRLYAQEGGRTTRGTLTAARAIAEVLNASPELAGMTAEERVAALDNFQRWFAGQATEFFNQKRIPVDVDVNGPAADVVSRILEAAGPKAGAVAQHLVGAKLAVRFSNAGILVDNHSFTTADQILRRQGDFEIGNTVFHVTVSPTSAIVDKCRENVRNDYRVKLLVKDALLQAARQLVSIGGLTGKVGVVSIEGFIGENVEELGEFAQRQINLQLGYVLSTYNQRVADIETDRSLLLDIPNHLSFD